MRCSTSGRLTPAAATRISTSPGPGRGTGRVSGTKTSGPPGALIAMARMLSGTLVTSWSPCFPQARLIDSAGRRVNSFAANQEDDDKEDPGDGRRQRTPPQRRCAGGADQAAARPLVGRRTERPHRRLAGRDRTDARADQLCDEPQAERRRLVQEKLAARPGLPP